jgi:hypothetical protein
MRNVMVAKWMGVDHILGLGLPISGAGEIAIMDERRECVHTHETGQMAIKTSAGE